MINVKKFFLDFHLSKLNYLNIRYFILIKYFYNADLYFVNS